MHYDCCPIELRYPGLGARLVSASATTDGVCSTPSRWRWRADVRLPRLKKLTFGSLEHFQRLLVTNNRKKVLDDSPVVVLIHELDHRTRNTVAIAAGPGVGKTGGPFT